jgi:thioester reductase-like protein
MNITSVNHVTSPDSSKNNEGKLVNVDDSINQQHYLITGFTGFFGKALVWKILRYYPNAIVTVVIRNSVTETSQQRLLKLLKSPIFSMFSHHNITAVNGDITKPLWGLDMTILSKVTCIISSAANVAFNLPFDIAIRENTISTEEGLKIAKNLNATFVYISTAYVNGYVKSLSTVKETLPIIPSVVHKLLQYRDFVTLSHTPYQISNINKNSTDYKQLFKDIGYPNTYTMSKAMAEHLVFMRSDVKSIILRPSIIIPAVTEPVPYQIDSNAGPNPAVLAVYLDAIKSIYAERVPFDLVPLDYVCDLCLNIIGIISNNIYHITASNSNNISPPDFFCKTLLFMGKPFNKSQIVNFYTVKMIKHMHIFGVKLLKPSQHSNITKIYNKMAELNHFTTNGWYFDQSNVNEVMTSITSSKHLKFTSMDNLQWNDYIRGYASSMKIKGDGIKSKL